PGPPTPQLGAALRLIADLESSGGAYVFRISEASLRRALDAGRTGDQLRAFLAEGSRTPIPQALRYLIDDAARRHGSVRVGGVSSYLRSDDPALLDRAGADRRLDGRRLHRLAPTAAVSDLSVEELLRVLREAGFAPMPENEAGAVIADAPAPARAPARRRADRLGPRRPSDAELAATVARLRVADAILSGAPAPPGAGPIHGLTSARTLELLRAAVVGGRAVGLALAESEGTLVARVLEPISLGGGQIRGYDPRSPGRLVSYSLHRIASVQDLGPVEAAQELESGEVTRG
ncbi:MAG: helicase-associated domain-containing protein, partial [Frankiaceae bacterium]|nr:helicase-associated domain-containing protein [Frankiaceae bacterium]